MMARPLETVFEPGYVQIVTDDIGVLLVDSREPQRPLLRFVNGEWDEFVWRAMATIRLPFPGDRDE